MNETSTTSARHRRSKHPRTVIAGPYGHPFHPILVTIPIGMWVASVLFDVIGFVADDPEPFVIGATVLIAVGLVGAVAAAIVGLLDMALLDKGTVARRTGLIHMTVNFGAMLVLTIGLVVRIRASDESVSVAGFVLTVVALAGTAVAGWLGGKLAYHFGVRVADEGTQAEGFR